jgi:hypothetical protein
MQAEATFLIFLLLISQKECYEENFFYSSQKSIHTMGREFIIELHLFESSLVGA